MDHLRRTFRALLDYGWSEPRFDASWFEVAWIDGHVKTPNNIALIRALLETKEAGTKRFGAQKVEDIFKEEVITLRERIAWEAKIVEQARRATSPMLQVPFALVRQEPVGHGCFHTGVLGTQRPLFRWVYDCGSWTKKDILKQRAERFAGRLLQDTSRETDIDLLFTSHFDADHISGLDYLLGRERKPPIRVHTAVIPYRSPAAAFAILASAAAEDSCTDALIGAVCKPARFFAERGVKRLIICKPKEGEPGTGDRPDPPPAPPRGSPPGPRSTDSLTPFFIKPDGEQLVAQLDPESGIYVAVAEYGTVCGIAADDYWADWWLLPYAYEWSTNREKLSSIARDIVGLDPGQPGFYEQLPEKLQSKEGIKQVKSIFASLDSNGTSLSLYTGPNRLDHARSVYAPSNQARPAGWLLTGDANLSSQVRMKEWKQAFMRTSFCTAHLMLPHHGAAGNFNEELITYAEGARHFVTVNDEDARNEKRPHGTVTKTFKAQNRTFDVVSEENASCIAEVSGPANLNDDYWRTKISKW
jgi:hypothetical protein